MLRVLKWVGLITVVVIAVLFIWKVFWWLFPKSPPPYLRTDLVSAQESDTFFTGFANLGVVRFKTSATGMQTLAQVRAANAFKQVKGYCYRLYEVSIGYPSLSATLAEAEAAPAESPLPDPQILTANVVDSRNGGEDVSTSQCDSAEYVTRERSNLQRLAELKQSFVEYGQWDSQRDHGRAALASTSRRLIELRMAIANKRIEALSERNSALAQVKDPGTLAEWIKTSRQRLKRGDAQSPDALGPAGSPLDAALRDAGATDPSALAPANLDDRKHKLTAALEQELGSERENLRAAGYMGGLKLTFSTIGIFSNNKRWFWQKDLFYIRQDLADATFGTDMAQQVSTIRDTWFSEPRLVISVPEPRLLAIDRYSTLQVTNGSDGFTLKSDDSGTGVEIAMRDDLEAFLRRATPQAIRFSKAAITAHLRGLSSDGVMDVEVRFVRDDPESSQVAELVRLMQEQRREPPKEK